MRSLITLLAFLCSSSLVSAQNVNTYIPLRAFQYLPLVQLETKRIMPNVPTKGYFGSLIEQESCISLKHSRCWAPTSELKSKRELGIGLGMITQAYRDDGSVRFDSLQEMRDKHRAELKELSWLTVKERPDLQIRAIMLMTRDNYTRLYMVKDPMARLAMTDAAYNGGYGGLSKERTACGLAKNCDPQYWFNHIEKFCLKGHRVLYGNRTACDINREHVHSALIVRLPKYENYMLLAEPETSNEL